MTRALTLTALLLGLAAPLVLAQATATRGNATQGNATQGNATQGNATQGNATQGNATQTTATKAAVNDSLFASAAASGGLAEVSISELGLQKATNAELKQFSRRMIDDHSKMNQQLTTLAAQKRIALPRTPDVRAQFCAQSLAGLSGEEFDRCYAKAQLVLHQDSLAMFEAEAERGQDPDVRPSPPRRCPISGNTST